MPIPKDLPAFPYSDNLMRQLYDSSLESMRRQMMTDRERLERSRNVAEWGDDRSYVEALRRDEAMMRRREQELQREIQNNPVYAVPYPSFVEMPDFSEVAQTPKPKKPKPKPVAEQIAEQKPYGAREIIFD